ncbi:MAG: RNA 2',3'-cyclic phosphodiesterase [Nanoarchaeota archaeon]|nr:RNA 2',3'-cyclic phosphodiesterase [Nanoarchaeota archaeon]MBU1643958.1 RNA 2',3'-cyclic phosphodiesterase [Nanoarchaeota archaeon]MBU1977395.1 RNA 2',3'-cyclic phosphodiesterase [Nanoarchaeota archaeon]
MKRLFVSVPVSEKIKEKIALLIDELKKTGADFNFVSLENLHFTVKFLGDVEESKLEEIKNKLRAALTDFKKFKIELKEVGVFPSLERITVIWIGVEGNEFVSLIKKVVLSLDYIRKEEHENIIPHLTIARVKSGRNKDQLQESLKTFKEEVYGTMEIKEIDLCESKLTSKGPVYTVLEKFSIF